MDFGLSEEQTLLQDTVSRYLTDNAPLDRVRAFAEDTDDGDLWQGLVELGASALIIPEDHGGVGLGYLDAALVAEALGYAATPSPFLGSAVAAPTAFLAANQHTDLLADLAGGALRVGLALAEANGARLDAGVDAANGKLTGTSLFVIGYPAQHYLVATRDQHLYLVDASAEGLEHRALTTVDATRPIGELTYSGVTGRLVSDNPAVLSRVLDVSRVMLAADTLGAAQNMLDQAVAYAKEREQFNRPIASFQAVKHMCAEMAAEIEPCRALLWYAGHALDEVPDEAPLMACHTKAHLSEVGKFVAKTATEVHGGMGFTDLVGLHYWYKRIGWNRQMLGTPEHLRERAAALQGLAA